VVKNLDQKYQVVIVKSLYDVIHEQRIRNFFMDVCALKVKGYSKGYPPGVLPLDACDFVGTHVVLCEFQAEGGYKPIMGFKSVTLERCDLHCLGFPFLGGCKSPDDTRQFEAYSTGIVEEYRRSKKSHLLAYNGSFTIDPDKKVDKEFMDLMWDLTFFLISSYYITEATERVVALCATKFKIQERKISRGWTPIKTVSGELGRLRLSSFYDAEVLPMELTDIERNCRVHMDRFLSLWDNRIVYEKKRDEKVAA
jgi:hypothetical protein